jgi:hypothetical protein
LIRFGGTEADGASTFSPSLGDPCLSEIGPERELVERSGEVPGRDRSAMRNVPPAGLTLKRRELGIGNLEQPGQLHELAPLITRDRGVTPVGELVLEHRPRVLEQRAHLDLRA